MIDVDDIRRCWRQAAEFLDERDRLLFAVDEAMAQACSGVTATAAADWAGAQHHQLLPTPIVDPAIQRSSSKPTPALGMAGADVLGRSVCSPRCDVPARSGTDAYWQPPTWCRTINEG